MFGALYASEGSSTDALVSVAAEFSPRYEVTGPRDVTLDLSGLTRLFGSARAIADELQRTAADRGSARARRHCRHRTAARLLARPASLHGRRHGATARLPALSLVARSRCGERRRASTSDSARLELLRTTPNELATFSQWGLRTLGDVAALPPDAVAARLGQPGVQVAAAGARRGSPTAAVLPFLRNASSRRSISSGRSTAWSRSPSSSAG